MQHMFKKNLALVCLRQVKGEEFAHAFATASISNKFTLSSKSSNVSYHFPLFLNAPESKSHTLISEVEAESEFTTALLEIAAEYAWR
jgi:hypothetical protein